MTARTTRLVKVAGVALGLLAGLAGGLYGYRAYASRSRKAAEAQAAAARAAEAQQAAAQPLAPPAAAGRPTDIPDGAPAYTRPRATPNEVAEVVPGTSGEVVPGVVPGTPRNAGNAVPGTALADAGEVPGTGPAVPGQGGGGGDEGKVPGTAAEGTAAEREARLMARLAGSTAVPRPGTLDAHPSERPASPPARSLPPPGSPAAREADLLRRLAEGGLPMATRPLLVRPPLAAIAPEARARADLLASRRQAAEARQARETAWPAIEEAEPPPGPRPLETPAAKPRPRAPRVELPSRLDQWGE